MEQPPLANICSEPVFEKLFFEHARSLHNFLYYKSGDEALAEDLAQEAFLRLWKKCRDVPYEKAKSFLYTVANNLFLDHIKHKKVTTRYHLRTTLPNSTPETPQYLLEESEFLRRLEEAIAALPEKSRVVFLLNRIDKKTYREIAELLDISVKAVEKRMHKALLELRKLSEGI